MADRELASTLMALDRLQSALRHVHLGLETLGCCDVAALDPVERLKYDQSVEKATMGVLRILEAAHAVFTDDDPDPLFRQARAKTIH